jgi:hypothetical protein
MKRAAAYKAFIFINFYMIMGSAIVAIYRGVY